MKQLRERAGLTQAELAVTLALDPVTIRNWEAGRTEPTLKPSGYRKLLEALKCTPAELEAVVAETIATAAPKKPGRPKKRRN